LLQHMQVGPCCCFACPLGLPSARTIVVRFR
jgi:hypothetical protein